MTKEEFKKLVEAAYSFQQLPAADQQRILAAEGAEMEQYVQMFEEEGRVLAKAYADFEAGTAAVVAEAKGVDKQRKAQRRVRREAAERRGEEEVLRKML